MTTLSVAADAPAACDLAAQRIARAAREAVGARGRAHVALAGGATPRGSYEALAALELPWESVDWWFADERAVAPEDSESNYRLVAEALLARAPVAAERVHRVPVERGHAAAAARYAGELRAHVPAGDDGVPVLDFALLGLGPDGHTASLFPDDPVLDDAGGELCAAVTGAKPPTERVTLTLAVLCAARAAAILATGPGMAWAVSSVLAAPSSAIPASLLNPQRLELILDEAAAPVEGER